MYQHTTHKRVRSFLLLITLVASSTYISSSSNKRLTQLYRKRINHEIDRSHNHYDFCIFITTYNRPELLLNLLQDIAREKKGFSVYVRLHDDCSTKDYSAIEEYVAHNPWITYSSSNLNRGKRGFWKTITAIYQEFPSIDARYFCSLQDDYHLVPNFFDKCIKVWQQIHDHKKICLNLILENQRFNNSVWGSGLLKDTDHVYLAGWVDMAFMCQKKFFETLHYQIRPISPNRWALNKQLSSGVGEFQTKRLRALGYHLYQVKKSLIEIVDVPSTMHDKERKKNPQKSMNVDYDYRKYRTQDPIIASMATIPERQFSLKKVVDAILPQVDHIYIYLNGHKTIPPFLNHPKITVVHSAQFGNIGDAGKFFWVGQFKGYHLTIDDDLNYPNDYVRFCISKIEQFNRQAIIGFHGIILHKLVKNYYVDRRCTCFWDPLSYDKFVHILGTGTTAYHTDTITLSRHDFPIKNMADIWLGIAAQKQRVPMVCVARTKNYLTEIPTTNSIVQRYYGKCPVQTREVNRITWKVHAYATKNHAKP